MMRARNRRATDLPMVLLIVLSVGGCALVDWLSAPEEKQQEAGIFPHNYHIEEEGLGCEDCHESDATPVMPQLETCMECHEGIDEDKPEDRRLLTLFGEEPKWTDVTALSDEINFSHEPHVSSAELKCNECHVGIEASKGITDEVAVNMDGCVACHKEKRSDPDPLDCALCHTEIGKDRRPATHRRAWKESHGMVVRSGREPDRFYDCDLCHTKTVCTSCHRDEPPRNHTNFWRWQGHSVMARVNRGYCRTCHRIDLCDRCHRDTPPMSHRTTWGSPRNRHCLICHAPLSGEGCAMCHKGTPSHAQAPPRPNDAQHLAATEADCRNCHSTPVGGHFDNGDACTGCH